jgi:ankyrin repeat protein
MARDAFIDNPAEEDKNCSIHNIFTSLRNEEEVEELDVVLATTDSASDAGTVHVADHLAAALQWMLDKTGERWDDINAFDFLGRSALHIACRYGASWEVINGLLGKLDDRAINAISKEGMTKGYTALHYACKYNPNSWEVINGLLGKLDEEAINARIDYDGYTALHTACANNASWEVINGLLGKLNEEAINAINKDGETALHNACGWRKSLEVINGLLGKLNEKAINAIGKNGSTALHIACVNGAPLEFINAIVTHRHGKEQVSIKDVNGKLPFDIFPAFRNRDEHLKKLLKLHDLMKEKDPTASSYPNGLLQSILNLPSEDRDEFEFMNHSYFRKTINAKIIQPFSLSILFLDVAVQGLVMAVFSFTINGAVKELPTTSMAGLIPCLLWLLFREIVQYLSATAKFYFGDAANFVDLIQIVLVIVVLLISFIGKGSIDEGLMVACIGVAWTRLIFVISNLHYSLALFVAALLQVSSSWYIDFTILAMM